MTAALVDSTADLVIWLCGVIARLSVQNIPPGVTCKFNSTAAGPVKATFAGSVSSVWIETREYGALNVWPGLFRFARARGITHSLSATMFEAPLQNDRNWDSASATTGASAAGAGVIVGLRAAAHLQKGLRRELRPFRSAATDALNSESVYLH